MTEQAVPIHIADAYALKWIADHVDEDGLEDLWDRLTELVENGALVFPRAVVAELGVIARGEPVQSWAAGLGSRLNHFTGNIKYARPLMGHVAAMGFENGFESLDNKDPSVSSVGRLACQYDAEDVEFLVVTEDVGENPLRPTMPQLAAQAGWPCVSAHTAITTLGCGDLML